jgi:hypothetical protein
MAIDPLASMNLAAGVNGAAGQYNIANNEPVLSVETLLTFCQSRLRTLDDQIRAKMDGQRANINLQTALNKVQSLLPKAEGGADEKANKAGLDEAWKAIEAAKAAAITAGDKDTYDQLCTLQGAMCSGNKDKKDGAGNPLDDNGKALDSCWGLKPEDAEKVHAANEARWAKADGVFNKQEAEGWIKSVEGMSANSRSNNEMSMISLQSMVSQRATALQLTTNMLNSMNESLKGITANIRS